MNRTESRNLFWVVAAPLSLVGLILALPGSISASPYSFEETLDLMEGLPLDSVSYKQSGLKSLASEQLTAADEQSAQKNCHNHEGLFFFYLDMHYQNKTQLKAQAVEAIREHGLECRASYWKRFVDRVDSVEFREAKRKADEIMSKEDIESIFAEPQFKDSIRKTGVYELFSTRQNLLKNWPKLRAAIEFVHEHCNNYCEQSEDIFLPAKLDLILDDDKISEIIPSNGDANLVAQFKDSWLKFRVCMALIVKSHSGDIAIQD